MKFYDRLYREVIDIQSLEIFKVKLDGTLNKPPAFIEDVPGHCRGVGLDDLSRSLPSQPIL